MENKQQMVAMTAYVASVKFEGRWYTSTEYMKIENALDFIKRARQKTHAQNMPCNLIEKTVYRAAQ
jgi:hypothetical protein